MVGKVFGSKEHAPINIAGMIIVLAIFGMLATPFLPADATATRGDLLKVFSGIGLAALTFLGGYLGGKASN